MIRGSSQLGLMVRFGIILLLLAGAWFVWFRFPLQRDTRVAREFCAGIRQGASTVEILQLGSRHGAATFESPGDDLLVVGFGGSKCALSLHEGVFTGQASVIAGD